MAQRLRLRVSNGTQKDQVFEVKTDTVRLGRSSSNDIHIPDEELSRNHCLFEPVGENGIRLTDLVSANGTFVNGKAVGSEPQLLNEGDLVQVGKTVIEVIGENKPAKVDLGLESSASATSTSKKSRSPMVNVLWLVALASAALAAWLIVTSPKQVEVAPAPATISEPQLMEVEYERVLANQDGIFRYELKFLDGVLSVRVDDVPAQNRHHSKSKPLSQEAQQTLSKLLAFSSIKEIDREYTGIEPDPPALDSFRLKLVYDSRARVISIVNTEEPAAFHRIRDQLESFSKSELGIWAIQYPKEKLIELATEAVENGNAKWEDRDVKHDNLYESILAYQEAINDLETVDPKPEVYQTAREGLRRATEELDIRYRDQRFLADRALNMGQFDVAKRELIVLLEMVPERTDERYQDANRKLLEAESRLKGGK